MRGFLLFSIYAWPLSVSSIRCWRIPFCFTSLDPFSVFPGVPMPLLTCLTGNLNVTCPKWDSYASSQICSFCSFPPRRKWHPCISSGQTSWHPLFCSQSPSNPSVNAVAYTFKTYSNPTTSPARLRALWSRAPLPCICTTVAASLGSCCLPPLPPQQQGNLLKT